MVDLEADQAGGRKGASQLGEHVVELVALEVVEDQEAALEHVLPRQQG